MIARHKVDSPTIPVLATAWGVSERRVSQYLAAGCPREVESGRVWIAANVRRHPLNSGERSGDSDDVRAQLLLAELACKEQDAEHRRLKNEKLRGELVARDDVERAFSELCLRVKARLEAFPGECEMLLPKEFRAVVVNELSDRVYLLLKEMADWDLGLEAATDDEAEPHGLADASDSEL